MPNCTALPPQGTTFTVKYSTSHLHHTSAPPPPVPQAPVLPHHKLSSAWGPILTSLLPPSGEGLGIRGPFATPTNPNPTYLTHTSDPANPTVHVSVALPSIPPADLVQLQAGFGDPDWNPGQEEAAHVAAGLAQPGVCGLDCHVTHDSTALVVDVPASRLGPVLGWLAHRDLAAWIAPRHRIQMHNNFASAIIQSGDYSDTAPSEQLRPFWAAGLNGTGEVVGVGDTGLDVNSCFFYDPEVEVK